MEVIDEGLAELKEFLDHELDDYGFNHKITLIKDCDDIWNVEIWIDEKKEKSVTICFKYDYEENGSPNIKVLQIEQGEDHWETVRSYDSTVKHLWMALLKWPF